MLRTFTLFLLFVLLSIEALAQKQPDTVRIANSDTILIREYNKRGQIRKVTTWIGDTINSTDLFWDLEGYSPNRWDTLEAIGRDTITVRKYRRNGHIKWEAVKVNEETILERDYYYDDSLFGYREYDPRGKGMIIQYESFYEFYLDSTPRIIGTYANSKYEGRYQTFYSNGNRQCDCHYKNGERDSIQNIYHSNGQLWTQRLYKNGMPWEIISNFDSQGDALEMGTLKDGTGTMLIYDDQGKLLYTHVYENGQLVEIDDPK
jgi:hypothetical protein